MRKNKFKAEKGYLYTLIVFDNAQSKKHICYMIVNNHC